MSYASTRLYNQDASDVQNQLRVQSAPSNSVQVFGDYTNQSSTPSTPVELPKVGHHRCYWALLSSDLQFIYLDPVLQFHLEEQAPLLLGQSLLNFVHPDEQATAKIDLGEVLSSKNVNGSVTRTRFCRLSRVRKLLGYNGPPPSFPSAEKISLDSNYMAVEIVLNYAAERLALCFIHASADIDPTVDNDKAVKSPWTNWCGTPVMPQEQLQLLSRRLLECVPQGSHDRMFQILFNGTGRPLLLSWPHGSSAQAIAAIANNVDFNEHKSEAKTNCTRRFRSMHDLQDSEVESVFIPHGSVIFACHKLSPPSPPSSSVHNTTSTTASIPDATVAAMGYNASTASSYSLPPPHPQQPSYYDQQHYTLPSLSSSTLSYSYAPPSHQQHSSPVSAHYPPYSSNWSTQTPTHPSVQNFRAGYWSSSPASYENPQGGPALSLGGPPQAHENYRSLSPGYPGYNSASNNASGGTDPLNTDHSAMPNSSADVVPPPRRRVSPEHPREYNRGENSSREGRGHGNRPSGVLKCSSCKATTSPEWRKGPSGKKELCNACGLRYARSRAKKEGHVPSSGSRRRKDKILKRDTSPPASTPSPASSGTPSSFHPSTSTIPYQTASTPPYGSTSSMRRSYPGTYDDSSFSSAGSAGSGSDIYAPHRSVGTPSPSPPAGTNFVPYGGTGSDGHGHRAGYYGSSIPSPLASNPPTMLPSQSFERESHRDSGARDPQTPVTAEPKSYYETTGLRESATKFERSVKKEEPRAYDRDYRDYEREDRGRGLISG